MAGSSAFYTKQQEIIGLPVPEVSIETRPEATPQVILDSRTSDGKSLIWNNWLVLTATNLPTSLLDPELDLRFDLNRYVGSKKSKRNGVYRASGGGFTHPATYDSSLPNPAGGDTHCGATNGVTIATRISEWPVLIRNQKTPIDVGAFFKFAPVFYRDATGQSITNLAIPTPTWHASAGVPTNITLRRISSRRKMPNRFTFSYSVKDLKKGKGRIVSAESQVFAASTHLQPFIFNEAASALNGAACATLNPNFQATTMQFWLEEQGT